MTRERKMFLLLAGLLAADFCLNMWMAWRKDRFRKWAESETDAR